MEVSCLRLHMHMHVFNRDSRGVSLMPTLGVVMGRAPWWSELAGVTSTVCDAVVPSVGVSFVVD